MEMPAHAEKQLVKEVDVAKFYKNHFNINGKTLNTQTYPDMYTGVRLNVSQAGITGSVVGTIKVEWLVSFHNRIPEAAA